MSTTEEKQKTYVWTKTERAGDVVTVDRTEGEFTYFTDGSRIFTNIMREMLMESAPEKAADTANAFKVSTGKVAQAPKPEAKAPEVTVNEPQPTGEVNVMLEMLRKLSAKNTISMPLEINIPTKDVYDLFKDQMDITKADLNEQITALVMSQIDNLQEQLRPQANDFIKQYYNGGTRTTSTRQPGSTIDASSSSSATGPDITY